MTQTGIQRVLLLAHGWGYNHRFFDPLVKTLPASTLETTLLACLEAGYFDDQAHSGLMIYTEGEWIHHPLETLHSLVLAHAEVPWLGLGHSLGFSKLLDFSVRWCNLISVHGFTRFVANALHPEGTAPRVLDRMCRKAEQQMPEVLAEFHQRCGHATTFARLNEQNLLADLRSMQTLDSATALDTARANGTGLMAWAGLEDKIVSLPLAQACFHNTKLITLTAEHAELARTPALYTGALLPLLSMR
jgi:hypothetical protein